MNKKVKYFFAHQKNIYICRVKISYFSLQKNSSIGEMAEWSIVAVSKTVVPSGTGGSNPPLSAERTGQYRTTNGQGAVQKVG